MIKGGYILQPRKLDESDISESPPHVREIWLYLLRKAFYKDGDKLKRGQLLTSYRQIINDLSWYVGYRPEYYKKHHCETAMKILLRKQMIQRKKTTRGMIITICNYDYYQTASNYETDNESDKKTTKKRQSTDTIEKERKNDNNEKKTYDDFIKLLNQISGREFGILDDKAKTQFYARIKQGWTMEQFKVAIKNLYNDEFHKDKSFKNATPEFITRSDKLEMYYNKKANKPGFSIKNL